MDGGKNPLQRIHLLPSVSFRMKPVGTTMTSGLKLRKFTGFLSRSDVPSTCTYKPQLFQTQSALPCLKCPSAYFTFTV